MVIRRSLTPEPVRGLVDVIRDAAPPVTAGVWGRRHMGVAGDLTWDDAGQVRSLRGGSWVAAPGVVAPGVTVVRLAVRVVGGVIWWSGQVWMPSGWPLGVATTVLSGIPVEWRPAHTTQLATFDDVGTSHAMVRSDGTLAMHVRGGGSGWPQFSGSYPLGG